jgi:hypothetical protein
MEKKTTTKIKENGAFETVEVTEMTPEDGIVRQKEIRPVDMDTRGKFHMGYSKNISFTTNDPAVTRRVAYGFCALFFVIGVFLLLSTPFLGVLFCVSAIACFVISKRDIDEVARKLKEKESKSAEDTAQSEE